MLDLSLLFAFAFCAGMVDAVVGGGGLIQIPALINAFPNAPAATLFGTNKLASVCGTAIAARTLDNGKKPLQALCAVMRKLLHAIHGMLKDNKPFDNTRFYVIPA